MGINKDFASIGLAVFTALGVAVAPAFAQPATVTNRDLNVRRGAGTSYPITYILRRGDRVEITRRQGNWAYIVGERGARGWVYSSFLSVSAPPSSSNNIFKAQGAIDNSRYQGTGQAQLVLTRQDRGASLSLSNPGKVSFEYLGTVRSNFEGTMQLQIDRFRSSEMGYRTVPVSGTCDIQASSARIRQAFCTVNGSGVDHGRTNFKVQ